MGKFYPSQFPFDGEPNERTVYQACKDHLGDTDWHCIFGYRYLNRNNPEVGECDCILLHPEHGLYVIEIKGQSVQSRDGKWFRGGKPCKNPWEQNREQVRHIWDLVQQHLPPHCNFPHAGALAFPRSIHRHDLGDLPRDIAPSQLMDAKDITDFGTQLETLVADTRKRKRGKLSSLNRKQVDAIISKAIFPELMMLEARAAEIEIERQTILRLSKSQRDKVMSARSNARLIIRGGAGTGKTVIAMACAQEALKNQESVLFLAFNTSLIDHLRASEQLSQRYGEGTIVFKTFHKLCQDAYKAHKNEDIAWPTDADEKAKFYNETMPGFLEEALIEGKQERYDHILIDEAQDFDQGWWAAIEELAQPQTGKITLFSDPGQHIFAEKTRKLPNWFQLNVHYVLRNTQAIAEFTRDFANLEVEPAENLPQGEKPQVHISTREDTPALIEQIVETLIEKDGISPRDILLISPRSFHNSSLAGIESFGNNKWSVTVKPTNLDPNAILHQSIARTKGLERDVVILFDIEQKEFRTNPKEQFYVGATRASHRLHIIANSKRWREQLLNNPIV